MRLTKKCKFWHCTEGRPFTTPPSPPCRPSRRLTSSIRSHFRGADSRETVADCRRRSWRCTLTTRSSRSTRGSCPDCSPQKVRRRQSRAAPRPLHFRLFAARCTRGLSGVDRPHRSLYTAESKNINKGGEFQFF